MQDVEGEKPLHIQNYFVKSILLKERLKHLFEAHLQALNPEVRHHQPGDVLMRQGESATELMLLTSGRVAIEISQQPLNITHTLAVIEAEELLGEIALFGIGKHSATVKVVEVPAEVVVVKGNQCLQAMLYDVDIAIEILETISNRFAQSNNMLALLLDGITTANRDSSIDLNEVCKQLASEGYAFSQAADNLIKLFDYK